jgi:hypothetical protein
VEVDMEKPPALYTLAPRHPQNLMRSQKGKGTTGNGTAKGDDVERARPGKGTTFSRATNLRAPNAL